MVAHVVASAYVGIYRYYRIARIVSLKDIPASFGKNRVSIWPVPAVITLSVLAVTISICSRMASRSDAPRSSEEVERLRIPHVHAAWLRRSDVPQVSAHLPT